MEREQSAALLSQLHLGGDQVVQLGERSRKISQHITFPQVSFKTENSWSEVNLMVSWTI